jgi:two-component system cell cycle sensor histidine kinase/response regulator CckA
VSTTILVVDDEPIARNALARALANEGHTVRTAPNGAVALAKLERERIDLILSEVTIPAVDGLTLTRHLRRRGDRIPVVLMSAARHAECEHIGVRCLTKPIDLAQMLDVVNQMLFIGMPLGPSYHPGSAANY